jgi:hypothetical protein
MGISCNSWLLLYRRLFSVPLPDIQEAATTDYPTHFQNLRRKEQEREKDEFDVKR